MKKDYDQISYCLTGCKTLGFVRPVHDGGPKTEDRVASDQYLNWECSNLTLLRPEV
jgi:hypothetical protein